MTLLEYIESTEDSDKRIQIINENYDVLYYGLRTQQGFDYSNCIVVKTENIGNAVDVVTIAYDD